VDYKRRRHRQLIPAPVLVKQAVDAVASSDPFFRRSENSMCPEASLTPGAFAPGVHRNGRRSSLIADPAKKGAHAASQRKDEVHETTVSIALR
jgi:hypothetical protein